MTAITDDAASLLPRMGSDAKLDGARILVTVRCRACQFHGVRFPTHRGPRGPKLVRPLSVSRATPPKGARSVDIAGRGASVRSLNRVQVQGKAGTRRLAIVAAATRLLARSVSTRPACGTSPRTHQADCEGRRHREVRAGDFGLLADLLSGAPSAAAIFAKRRDLQVLDGEKLTAESRWQMLRPNRRGGFS